MRKLIISIVLLVLFIFAVPCLVSAFPNLFIVETRIPVDSEVDPWDLFYIEPDGQVKCKWKVISVFGCPQGDIDTHIVIANPDPAAEIDIIELVVGDGQISILPAGSLFSYSYMKKGEWHMFLFDFKKKRYVRYKVEEGHGGSIF